MEQNTQRFEFHGKTGEFFKIWIVNLMLSIVTLGIYSAWAKVRTRQYFYSNTLLMNTPFDYLADPIKILKGRLLALAVILIYSFSAIISPLIQAGIMLIFIPLFPWIIIKALKFNLYNSAYRNIRFHFSAEYLKALLIFVGLPILVALTAGLAYPYFNRERKNFILQNSAYGTHKFEFSATTSQFYSVYLKTLAVIIIALIFLGAMYFVIPMAIPMDKSVVGVYVPIIIIFMFYPALMIVFGYLYTTIANLTINHTQLKTYQFESNLETGKICWLFFSNIVAIICSFGLLIPWAMIRTAKYRISCLAVMGDEDPEIFIAAEAEKADAVGEELGDLLDIDIGL